LGHVVDRFVALSTPGHFTGVGEFYEHFEPVSDQSMIGLLVGLREEVPDVDRTHDVRIPIGEGLVLDGSLRVPDGAATTVVFAHGSGSSRHSPRNRYVADVLDRAGYATLLFDLLTPGEALDRARLLADVTRTLSEQHVNILSASVSTSKDRTAISRFTFEMADATHLDAVLSAVRNIEGVYDVYRTFNN
jgi:pimeloyl-ACP methyl ester carboxylesterase